ncbi:MAG: NAD(P)/FAD-dependent oxidoreductase [Steroidobacteraceae bacterium]|jgi:phytoene dehydrogenase-like protein|nr:NAD(P)/FAD-dependent oxidoreductase [Steroidobacteraceae bacterium]
MGRFDAIVIGAGHNGLTCACYLAKSGLKVAIFERWHTVGGTAVTEEFHPGFRNSTASYTVSLLDPKVITDLRLAEHGLRILERPVQNFLPLPGGDAFSAGPRAADTLAEARRFSARDAARLPDYHAMLGRAVALLRTLLARTPPTDLRRARDLWETLSFGRRFRALPLAAQREIHELFTRSAGEILDHWFEAEPLKALLGFDSVVGNYASPYTPGSGYVLLHHAFGQVNGQGGAWGHAVGGMGAITEAMAREAARLGVQVECDAPVRRVLTRPVTSGAAPGTSRGGLTGARGGATDALRVARDAAPWRAPVATGVELEDGRVFEAATIAANVGPKPLFLSMLEPGDLPADFRAHIERFRTASATFRMNVALAAPPRFATRAGAAARDPAHLGAGIIVAPSLRYMDRAFADARLHGISREPIVEMLLPSVLDDSLAPRGAHVASLFCQHFDYHLPGGRSWRDDAERERAADLVIDTVERCAPGFRASVVARSALSPLDLERRFGLAGGDIFHGALGLDQLWAARPALGYGDYRTPVDGLWLCGSGAHPGGGVTGLPGHNAARAILARR